MKASHPIYFCRVFFSVPQSKHTHSYSHTHTHKLRAPSCHGNLVMRSWDWMAEVKMYMCCDCHSVLHGRWFWLSRHRRTAVISISGDTQLRKLQNVQKNVAPFNVQDKTCAMLFSLLNQACEIKATESVFVRKRLCTETMWRLNGKLWLSMSQYCFCDTVFLLLYWYSIHSMRRSQQCQYLLNKSS